MELLGLAVVFRLTGMGRRAHAEQHKSHSHSKRRIAPYVGVQYVWKIKCTTPERMVCVCVCVNVL